jgi:hypothetical protein
MKRYFVFPCDAKEAEDIPGTGFFQAREVEDEIRAKCALVCTNAANALDDMARAIKATNELETGYKGGLKMASDRLRSIGEIYTGPAMGRQKH